MADFNPGSPRIGSSALSSKAVVGYVSQLAQVVKKEFGGEKTDV